MLQSVIGGVIRATGKQLIAAVINFVSYYLIGLPLGISLALVVGLGTKGMWIGLSLADGIQVRPPHPARCCNVASSFSEL